MVAPALRAAMAAPGCEETRAAGLGLGAGPPQPGVPPHPGVARRRGRTLLVRHLPAELTAAEKEDLLKHFGAVSVRVLSDHGRLVRAGAWGGSGRRGQEERPAAALGRLPRLRGGGAGRREGMSVVAGSGLFLLPTRGGAGAVPVPGEARRAEAGWSGERLTRGSRLPVGCKSCALARRFGLACC